ncbi:MBL fold metallo-hydrolase [Salinicoccus sp. ID82-1]|uniref:MBL fold metallo-hydrolase n=1 Tax=Salinicoccus sp. ID82-1 TaxID=2820269 RepID=UPI001F1884D8|nr:MBL fold metallo-hydrolase [Salinicoccus sp. ID82-1]MCG1009060.1 MBL fold metallo-hydrolase [Salinicoccus sp. ID82-1]
MKFKVLGSGAGIPSRTRNTQSFVLDVVEEINQYFLIDASEALQHRILDTTIRPSKIKHIFITHLHGDHIFGLPGFLSSRAHQGGEGIPLVVHGPKGLEEWVEATFRTSSSHLNYPIQFNEVGHGDAFDVEGFTVTVRLLDHAIDSFLYVFEEPDKPGALKSEKLRDIGIRPGPVYKEIKSSDTFEHEGIIYETADFLNAPSDGRKIAVHGDTRVIRDKEYLALLDGADLIVHEATYLHGEQEKAHLYFHSEIDDVLMNLSQISYCQLLFSHISNRYDAEMVQQVEGQLAENIRIAHDFLEITIPRDSR